MVRTSGVHGIDDPGPAEQDATDDTGQGEQQDHDELPVRDRDRDANEHEEQDESGPGGPANGVGLLPTASTRGAVRRSALELRSGGAGAGPDHRHFGAAGSVRTVPDPRFVPTDFEPPTALVSDHFRLEPLGPQHNEADHAAWTSSIAHVRSTPGFPDGSWPPPEGMSLDGNLDDLRRHAADFEARTGFTFTVLDPDTGDVIGCVYLYPSDAADADVTVQSWVRASHAELDVALADAVAAWLAAEWPWERVHRPGR